MPTRLRVGIHAFVPPHLHTHTSTRRHICLCASTPLYLHAGTSTSRHTRLRACTLAYLYTRMFTRNASAHPGLQVSMPSDLSVGGFA
jgi:hypothetical protein